MFYILRSSFMPNTASANRAIAYYKAMDEMGIEATIVILQADKNRSKIPYSFKHIKVEYWWDHFNCYNKVARRLQYFWNLIRFINQVRVGDKVYIYGSSHGLHSLLKKKGVGVFLEITEHPLVHPIATRFLFNSHHRAIEDCKKLTGLFVISEFLKRYYVEEGVSPSNIHIINMIVDKSRFNGLIKTTTERYICYCGNSGNNRKEKIDELINVFSSIANQYPDVNLLVIGPRPSAKSDTDFEMIHKKGLDKRVILTGIVPADEIPQILVNAELLALNRPDTLQNRAGFPTKLGEYLLSKTPVIATEVGDLTLFLKDMESAFITRPGDALALTEKITWALDNPEMARVIGNNGYQVAINNFCAEIETRKLLSYIL